MIKVQGDDAIAWMKCFGGLIDFSSPKKRKKKPDIYIVEHIMFSKNVNPITEEYSSFQTWNGIVTNLMSQANFQWYIYMYIYIYI